MERSRSVLVLLILVALVVLGVLLFGSETDRPFDLDSAAPSGYKGLRLTLEGLDAPVERIDVDALGDDDRVERF